jgi:hypothetical protein
MDKPTKAAVSNVKCTKEELSHDQKMEIIRKAREKSKKFDK